MACNGGTLVGAGECEGLALREAVDEGVCVLDGVEVPEGVTVEDGVPVGVTELEALADADEDGVEVEEGVIERDMLPLGEAVSVRVELGL